MNKYDRENVEFLLSIDSATVKDWYDKMDSDDIEYATEIMNQYSAELAVKCILLNDDVEDISTAVELLKKFTL